MKRDKIIQVDLFTNLSLMTNTAILNTSNKNTNNCGKINYILRRRRKEKEKKFYCLKLRNIQTLQSKTDAILNFNNA